MPFNIFSGWKSEMRTLISKLFLDLLTSFVDLHTWAIFALPNFGLWK